jgi:TrmH family RNA methyltransferase
MMLPTADPSSWPVASKRRTAVWAKLRTKKGRRASGLVIIEGIRQVCEALVSRNPVEALLVADSPEGQVSAKRVLSLVEGWPDQGVRLAPRDFTRISDTVNSAGIAAIVGWRPATWEEFTSLSVRRILFCDRLTDPGNLGTLVRTAAGLGLEGVCVGPNSVELGNPKTIRATAGAIFRIPVFSEVPIEPFIAWCDEHRYIVFVADRNRGNSALREPPGKTKGWALVIGGETSGPDPAWERDSTQWVRIPMQRGVESFNAAVAGAILMDRLCNQGS